MRNIWIASASVIAIASGATTAAAQAGGAEGVALEEVIVTAQKREQRLLDVPVAVTVVGAGQMDRAAIKNIGELQFAVPTLNFNAGPVNSYSVRGVGTATFTRSAENGVSIVVDGVVQGQLVPPSGGLFDVARVEVLSGPQGMLFGKNASAGVVNIVTTAPVLGQTEFSGKVDLGEAGLQSYRGIANLPLGETSALRISAFSDSQQGRLWNRYQGRGRIGGYNNAGVRARLLWEPTDDVSVNIVGDYEKDHGGNALWTSRKAGGVTSVLNACGVTPGPENTDLCVDGAVQRVVESYGVSAQVDWTVAGHTLTSITAARQFSRFSNNDSDTLPINGLNVNVSRDFSDQVSQEFRIASPAGQRLEYVLGAYYYNYAYKASGDQAGQIFQPILAQLGLVADRTSLSIINQASYALFGQATFNLNDQFAVVAGARQTWDLLRTNNTAGIDPASGIFVPGFSGTLGKKPTVRVSNDNLSYRIGLQYKPNADTLIYATYAKGYKGAATNTGESAGLPVIQPEIPISVDIGFKTTLFDRRLMLDIVAYDQDFQNYQAQFSQVVNGLTTFVFGNAGHLYVRGVEFNASARPIAGLRLDGGFIYNDATYGSFFVPCKGGSQQLCNVEGRQLAGAPKWKFVASGEYAWDVSSDVEAYVQLSANYRTRMNAGAAPDPELTIDGYALVDGRVGVRGQGGRWGASVFVKNLFDERFPAAVFADPLIATNYDQAFSPNAFRTIGVSLEGRF